MKHRLLIITLILITAFGGYIDSIEFWKGNLQIADIFSEDRSLLLNLGLWVSQILIFVGILGAFLLFKDKPSAKYICYIYFIGIFISSLPAVLIMTQRFGPVWVDSTVPYGWEIIKLGWPLVGVGMLFMYSNVTTSAGYRKLTRYFAH